MMKCKRILTLVLCLITLVSAMSVTAFAANTQNKDIIDFKIKSSEWYYLIPSENKTDRTPVYLYYTKGTYNAVRVRVFGQETYDTTKRVDCTWYNGAPAAYVTCRKGTEYSIRSKVYENELPWARLGFWSQYVDTITGVWSPDSTRTYTVAAP